MKVKSTYIWWEADQKSRFWHYTQPDLAQVSAGGGEDRHRDNNNTQKSASVNHDQKNYDYTYLFLCLNDKSARYDSGLNKV